MLFSKNRIAAAAVLLSMPCIAFAQDAADYPSRAVRIIVGSSAGGGTDLQTRLFAQKLGERMRRQFVVENHPGGGNTIGYGLGAKAAPDGYTLLAVSPIFTFVSALHSKLTFDPVKDFKPISLLSKAPFLLLVHPSLPVKTVSELVRLAKARPGQLNLGVENGSTSHLAAAWLVSEAKIKVALIPYKGTGQVLPNAIAGNFEVSIGNVLASMPLAKAGRLRALAVTSAERSAVLPELPTVAESGIPGYDVTTWAGWVAPAGTPERIITKLSGELGMVAQSAAIGKSLVRNGGVGVGSTPEQFRRLINTEIPRWSKVVRDAGMRME